MVKIAAWHFWTVSRPTEKLFRRLQIFTSRRAASHEWQYNTVTARSTPDSDQQSAKCAQASLHVQNESIGLLFYARKATSTATTTDKHVTEIRSRLQLKDLPVQSNIIFYHIPTAHSHIHNDLANPPAGFDFHS